MPFEFPAGTFHDEAGQKARLTRNVVGSLDDAIFEAKILKAQGKIGRYITAISRLLQEKN